MLDGYVVVINFPRGSVRLTKEYIIEVEGLLYPRELAAASHIVSVYKEQMKLETGQEKKAANRDKKV